MNSTIINIKMKNIILVLTLVLAYMNMDAQVRYIDERYASTMSYLNPVFVNPGATGTSGTHQMILNYKNTWATHPKSPKTFLVSYDGRVADRLGFGAMFMSDRNGSLEISKVQGSLSYTIDSPTNLITGGISGEYIKHGLSDDVLTDGFIDPSDVVLLERAAGNGFFDVSLGLHGLYDSKIMYGISLPSILSSRVNSEANDEIDREFGIIAYAGYKYMTEGIDAVFEPSLFVKKLNHVPTHADINLLGRFVDDKFRGGISYTAGAHNGVGFLLGLTFNSMSLNYTFNASRNNFQQYNNGTHEFSLRFDIGGQNAKGGDMMEMKEMMPESVPIKETINN